MLSKYSSTTPTTLSTHPFSNGDFKLAYFSKPKNVLVPPMLHRFK